MWVASFFFSFNHSRTRIPHEHRIECKCYLSVVAKREIRQTYSQRRNWISRLNCKLHSALWNFIVSTQKSSYNIWQAFQICQKFYLFRWCCQTKNRFVYFEKLAYRIVTIQCTQTSATFTHPLCRNRTAT